VDRKGELICAPCIGKEQTQATVREAQKAEQDTTGPLGHYEQAVWSCDSCGIPVTALDLIEGRAARVSGMIRCTRCSPAQTARPAPPVPAPPAPAPRAALARPAAPSRPAPRATLPRPVAANAAEAYVAQASMEQKRPVLPVVMFAIVLPMFAVSLYFAVSSQVKLNDAMAAQNKQLEALPDPRSRRPVEELTPERERPVQPGNTSYTPPVHTDPDPIPTRPPEDLSAAPPKRPLPPDVLADLAGVETALAKPVIALLQSSDRAEVWQGLIAAGAQRLIAARPFVRALLRDQDDQLRAVACRVTGMLQDEDALGLLGRMVEQDPSEPVRLEARKARDRMTGKASRDIRDMTDAELSEMIRDLQRELQRRKGGRD
jgi:hypothetical protein